MSKQFITHFGGVRPKLIRLDKSGTINIYSHECPGDMLDCGCVDPGDNLQLSIPADKVEFINKANLLPGVMSGLLIKQRDDTYIYVCKDIFSFTLYPGDAYLGFKTYVDDKLQVRGVLIGKNNVYDLENRKTLKSSELTEEDYNSDVFVKFADKFSDW